MVVLAIDRVERAEVLPVGEVDTRLDDVLERAPCLLEDDSKVPEHGMSLRSHPAGDELPSLGIVADLTGYEHEVAGNDRG